MSYALKFLESGYEELTTKMEQCLYEVFMVERRGELPNGAIWKHSIATATEIVMKRRREYESNRESINDAYHTITGNYLGENS